MPVDLVAQLRLVPRQHVEGLFVRHTLPRAPLDEPPPVVLAADRWQRVGDESCLFACDSEATCWAEWRRKLPDGVDPAESVRKIGWLTVALGDVVDLRDRAVQERLAITDDDLVAGDCETCRRILAAARVIGLDGLLSRSAARPHGTTLIVLPHAIKRVEVVSEELRSPPAGPPPPRGTGR
jgi:hypothetical protein